MIKSQHLFENGIYHIGNHSVARNPMFTDSHMQNYFLEKMENYLSPLCKVLAYSLNKDEFQIIVKLKDRKKFEDYFKTKSSNKDAGVLEIPDSTYIFSQAMANLQVSFVKHFNYVFKRSGTLMASRFTKNLIEGTEELADLIKSLNSAKKFHNYSELWVNKLMNNADSMTSGWFYEDIENSCGRMDRENGVLLNYGSLNLVSYFKNLPSVKLESSKRYFIMKFNRLFGPIHSYKL